MQADDCAFPQAQLFAVEREELVDLATVNEFLFLPAGGDSLIELGQVCLIPDAVLGQWCLKTEQAVRQ